MRVPLYFVGRPVFTPNTPFWLTNRPSCKMRLATFHWIEFIGSAARNQFAFTASSWTTRLSNECWLCRTPRSCWARVQWSVYHQPRSERLGSPSSAISLNFQKIWSRTGKSIRKYVQCCIILFSAGMLDEGLFWIKSGKQVDSLIGVLCFVHTKKREM